MIALRLLAEVQTSLGHGGAEFRAFVTWSDLERAHVLRIEVANPGRPFALLDAVGRVFGAGDVVKSDGCESCGFGSAVDVDLYVVLRRIAERSRSASVFAEQHVQEGL